MGLFDNFPYNNFHELNLDWILCKLGLLNKSVEDAGTSATAAAQSASEAAEQAASAEAAAEAAAQSAEEAQTYAHYGRRFIFIGDSYADGWDPENSSTIKSWVGYIKDKLKLNSYSCYENHAGGAGFVAVGQTGKTFAGLLSEIAPSVKDGDTITDIVVLGGYNDREQSSAINSAISSFITTAAESYPNAIVRVGWIGRNVSASKSTDVVTNVFRSAKEYIQAEASYLSGIEYACRNAEYFFNDGIHPNTVGQKAIAKGLYNCLTAGSYFPTGDLAGMSLTGGEVDYSSINCQQIGANIVLHFPTKNISISKTGNCDGAVTYDCGEIRSGPLLTALYNAPFQLSGGVVCDGKFTPATILCVVDNSNHLQLSPISYSNAGTGWAKNPTEMRIFVNTVTVPAYWH